MNQPDRYERFVLPEGTRKVTYEPDSRLPHAGTYVFEREDHTLGNLLRMQLHEDPAVIFSGYRVPHPLEHKMVVKVQTTGAKTPQQAMAEAVSDVRQELQLLKDMLSMQIASAEAAAGQQQQQQQQQQAPMQY